MKFVGLFEGIGSGVYSIENSITGQFYVGSSINLKKRITAHLCLLRNNKHTNIKLQRSFQKYGENNFTVTVLEVCGISEVIKREQYYVDTLKPHFNLRLIVESSKGVKLSEHTKRKMSLAKKGKPLSKASANQLRTIQADRIGVAVYGKVKESLKLGSASLIGKPKSEETKEKIRLLKIGKKFDKINRKYY